MTNADPRLTALAYCGRHVTFAEECPNCTGRLEQATQLLGEVPDLAQELADQREADIRTARDVFGASHPAQAIFAAALRHPQGEKL